MVNPVLVALDFPTLAQAEAMADSVATHVGGFKVGLELIMSEGPRAVETIANRGLPVFADVKLQDIPNTVSGAARGMRASGARWITVHAAGGGAMLDAAVEGMGDDRGVLAVTVLTSLDADDLVTVGVDAPLARQVERLAALAARHGTEGVICSPHEAELVKAVSQDLLTVTPGIRVETLDAQDQKRVSTPVGALSSGADLLVIGRAITDAADPVLAAARIEAAIADASVG